MGLVQRQGIKYSIVNLAGLVIGVASTLFIYPKVLQEVGMLRFLNETSLLLYPALSLGINAVTIRFFPRFLNKENGNNGYLGLLLAIIGLGFSIFLIAGLIYGESVKDWYLATRGTALEYSIFERYFWVIYPVAGLTLANSFLMQYAMNFNRIVIGSILNDFIPKITTPLLLLSYYYHWISLDWVFWGLIGQFMGITIGLVFYLKSLGQWHIKLQLAFVDRALRIEMVKFAGFGLLSAASYMMILKLDSWSVTTFLGLAMTGVYSIASLFTNVLDIPMKAVIGATAPILAKHWAEENHAALRTLYQKASINLLLPGLALFGAICLSIDKFFDIFLSHEKLITTDMLYGARWVVILLGVSKIVELATGINNYLINYSKYYYYQLGSLAVMGISNIALNLLLVKTYGMQGAAAATLVTTILYNAVSVTVMWWKFKYQPFTRQTFQSLALALILYILISFIPDSGYIYVDLILKSGLYMAIFSLLVIQFEMSADINQLVRKLIAQIRRR